MTVPSVWTNFATILSEIGDIQRFHQPSKLVAYAGIAASVSQFKSSGTSISKHGSSHLRRALFQAAITAQKHDPVLKTFYEKKREQGQHYYVCIEAVAKKLCYIIYAILKSTKPYKISSHTTEV